MSYQTQPRIHRLMRAAVLPLLALLAACGSLDGPTPPAQGDDGFLLTVPLAAGDTRTGVAARFGGEVIAWLDGQAVLKLSGPAAAALQGRGVSLQNTTLEPNQRAAAPSTVRASGWNSWAGGWGAWAGGWNSWAGGNGSVTSLTSENNALWTQIGLAEAQRLAPNLGRGVKVAVIDSGADLNHPALSGRIAERWDYVGNDATPQEEGAVGNPGFGHGTSVAGIVAQVAPNARIMVYRVLGADGSGLTSSVVSAVNAAVSAGAQVINLSLGTPTASPALTTALCSAASRGIYVVASAGNNNTDGLTFPAQQSRSSECRLAIYLISVSSVDANDVKSSFANRHFDLSMTAPGERIFGPAPGGRLAHWSGTSMAAPLVSGSLALALGQNIGTTGSLKSSISVKGVPTATKNLSLGATLGASRLFIPGFLNDAPQ